MYIILPITGLFLNSGPCGLRPIIDTNLGKYLINCHRYSPYPVWVHSQNHLQSAKKFYLSCCMQEIHCSVDPMQKPTPARPLHSGENLSNNDTYSCSPNHEVGFEFAGRLSHARGRMLLLTHSLHLIHSGRINQSVARQLSMREYVRSLLRPPSRAVYLTSLIVKINCDWFVFFSVPR